MILSKTIKKIRKDQKLTIEKLAEKAKVNEKTIRNIEGGKKNCTLQTVKKIAAAMGYKTFYSLRGKNKPYIEFEAI